MIEQLTMPRTRRVPPSALLPLPDRFLEAADLAVKLQECGTIMLHNRLGIPIVKCRLIINALANKKIVSNSSDRPEVLMSKDDWARLRPALESRCLGSAQGQEDVLPVATTISVLVGSAGNDAGRSEHEVDARGKDVSSPKSVLSIAPATAAPVSLDTAITVSGCEAEPMTVVGSPQVPKDASEVGQVNRAGRVPLNQLAVDPSVQLRDVNSTRYLAAVAERVALLSIDPTHANAKVVAFDLNGYLTVADGHIWLEAATQTNLADIQVEVRRGDLRDAQLYAVLANSAHGVQLSDAERHAVVVRFLDDPHWSEWSLRTIAKLTGVSHTTVEKIKEQRDTCKRFTVVPRTDSSSPPAGSSPLAQAVPSTVKYMHKGKVRTMNVQNLKGRKAKKVGKASGSKKTSVASTLPQNADDSADADQNQFSGDQAAALTLETSTSSSALAIAVDHLDGVLEALDCAKEQLGSPPSGGDLTAIRMLMSKAARMRSMIEDLSAMLPTTVKLAEG